MNSVSQNLESQMFALSGQLMDLNNEINDIVKAYFSTSATSLISGAATNGTAVTVTSRLTKAKYINGITLCQQLQNFFGNQSVAGPSDYMLYVQNLINGSDTAGSVLSADVEAIGDRLRAVGVNLLAMYKQSKSMLAAYNSSQLAAALVPVDSGVVVFGCSTTKQKMVDAMNLISNLTHMLDSIGVTTGDYLSIVTTWTQGS